ncbi:type II secretion system protein [Thermosulfurimonas dismutans]|uniref:type II secretion system protein n=1 Tax=Thermosulfurimonas dismutans TaxID=999894 RepID=UPI000838437E|nr:prepilin-type N-terminal cleavage/methylation domain-containing protein [Thermosulfurimonas dismutans]
MLKRGTGARTGGFTLVELAIVLVIIGLLLGMALKGRQLIKSAREDAFYNKLQKISAAINIFYERYNRLPGDGCTNNPSTGLCTTSNTYLNGRIDTTTEQAAFWSELRNTGLLTEADRREPFTGKLLVFSNYSSPPYDGIWLETAYNEPASAICRVDQKFDDGNAAPSSGGIIFTDAGNEYDPDTDCDSLTGVVEGNFNVYRY